MRQERNSSVVYPSSWIGVLGGGQLGRMFVHAAQRMGYHVQVFDPEPNCPAGQAADLHLCPGDPSQAQNDLIRMANECAAITLEFENVDVDYVSQAAKHTCTRPSAQFLAVCQDRILEKKSMRDLLIPTTSFVHCSDAREAQDAGMQFGWPLVLKTTRSGYDGKGQFIVRSAEELQLRWSQLNSNSVIAEQWVEYIAEVSMLVARNANEEVVTYPLFENSHHNHILDITRCPVSEELQTFENQAQNICKTIVKSFDVQGLICVEFFITRDGRLLVNEIAPRPHNSGHLTIEAFECSQFEMQVRSLCNLPLPTPEQLKPAAMANLLGDVWTKGIPKWENVLCHPHAHLHLYGKQQPRPGRKMGHLTCLADTAQEAVDLAVQLRERLAQ